MIESLALVLLLGAPVRAQDVPTDFSDQGIEQKQKDLDRFYEIYSREVQQDYSDEMDFESQLENERLSFEKKLILKRKQFLESLKKISPLAREQAFLDFWNTQQRSRQEFLRKQDQERRAFDSKDQRGLRRRQRDVIEDYDDASAEPDGREES